ncbi:PP-loop family-domain-containing protein [Hygrophoropsis aurantiaca]|uniref:PP-loop family-domain-containing protein n=1 Tax=Hygrophoropsis aurantiaca TaxID=72124 RepID=A0ACB8AL45_9AGAM|nr:PP-loop family-domain-containing protein [Hygrophoropsis aurantiaca]
MPFIPPYGAAAPITRNEFFQMFMRCTPPSGWSPNSAIVVGNSGGPDSTCLLFLINQLLRDPSRKKTSKPLPPSAVSIAVDHDLQTISGSMANRASITASFLDTKHLTLRIPWSVPPYPPKPAHGESMEQRARAARYHMLFHGMTRVGADTIALGHHADDQVETSLMRLARGTTELGAGGMRRCRRWGMGFTANETDLGYSGLEGMKRWIVRPFLEVRKDRILATCDANGLEYVNDPSNFQPEITLRNAIRHMLDGEGSSDLADKLYRHRKPNNGALPPDILNSLEKIKAAAAQLQSTVMDISGGREQLRGAVKVLSSRVEDIDAQVTTHLKKHTLPSPPGTFLLSTHNLSTITDQTVRSAMVLRILRYISFHPWGSVRADGNRRDSSLQSIIKNLWTRDPWETPLRPFTAGSGVLWSPAIFNSERPLKVGAQYIKHSSHPGDRFAWLASRLPYVGVNKSGAGVQLPPNLDIDITTRLIPSPQNGQLKNVTQRYLDVLYDCRYLVRFDLQRIPGNVVTALQQCSETSATVRVVPISRYCWPKVVLTPNQPAESEVVLAALGEDGTCQHPDGTQPWITMEWIRLLDAT